MAAYAYYYNKKMKAAFKRNRDKIADINAQIEDNLSGIRVVKSFANEEVEKKKFNYGNEQFLLSKKNSYKYMAGYNSGINAFITLITIVVLVAGATLITKNSLAVADLVTFLLYINNFTEPVKKLLNFTEQFQNGVSGYERFLEILSVQPDIIDDEDAVDLKEAKGKIEFENVCFHYKDVKEMVLNNINLSVEEGEYIALVGASGVGKSTLCSLIPRFYDVTEGRILIDGTDTVSYTHLCYNDRNVGFVSQSSDYVSDFSFISMSGEDL